MEPNSTDGTLVTIVLIAIAIVAVLTIVCMVIGARKKRERAEAERIERERVAATRPKAPPSVRIATPPPPPPPVAPPPPPLTDLPEVSPEPLVETATANSEPLADEPIAAAAPLDAAPAVEAQASQPEPEPEQALDGLAAPGIAAGPGGEAPVTTIKGLGPKVAALLAQHGVVTVGDLAALDQRAAEDLDARLGAFTGRMGRDRWLEQAKLLASGDRKTFEERFGKL